MRRCRVHGRLAPDDDTCEGCDELLEQRDETNACPECDTGVVVSVGPPEWETGHQPYACIAGCGYNG